MSSKKRYPQLVGKIIKKAEFCIAGELSDLVLDFTDGTSVSLMLEQRKPKATLSTYVTESDDESTPLKGKSA